MEENVMRFRLAGVEDIPLLCAMRLAMLNEVADAVPTDLAQKIEGYLTAHLRDGSCLCALLEQEGCAVATAMLCAAESVPDEINTTGRFAMLANVYTQPAHRGKGYMEALLRWLLEEGRKAGVREVFAGAERKAIPLYRRIGFTLTETEMFIQL